VFIYRHYIQDKGVFPRRWRKTWKWWAAAHREPRRLWPYAVLRSDAVVAGPITRVY